MGANAKEARFTVKVLPNAGRNEVVGLSAGIWRIKLAAAPEKGRANKELIAFLSDVLGLKKDNLSIIRGQNSRIKVLLVEGLTQEEVLDRLSCK